MTVKFKDITRNALSISVGQGLAYFINFLAFVLIVRYLTISDFGKFSFFVAAISIISKFIDFGFVPIVFRKYSVKKDNSLLNTAFTLRTVLFFIAFLIINVLVIILKYSNEEIIYINILLLSIIISSRIANFRELLTVPFKSELKMHIPMLINIIDNIIFLFLVIILPLVKGNLLYLIFVYVFANLPGFFAMLVLAYKKYDYKFNWQFNRTKWLLRESLPLAGFVLVMVMFQQIDILLLKYFKGENDIAIFSASLRFIMPLNIIPMALSATAFPIIMQNIQDQNYLRKLIEIVNKFLFLIAIVLVILLTFKSNDIILISLGSKYQKSVFPFSLMLFSQVFFFVNFFALSIFTAYKKQIWNLYYSLILLLSNFLFDLILIPSHSYNGAAIAKLITSVIGFIFIIQRIYHLNFTFFSKGYRVFLWVFLLLIIGYGLSFLPIVVYFILYPVVIFLSIIAFKIITLDEMEIILKLLNKEKFLIPFKRYFH